MSSNALPVDEVLPQLLQILQHSSCAVLEAPPGAGKTTRVPRALMESGTGEIVVLEPRRIAARLAARRVAAELGEPVGERVGYQVRFDEKVSSRTRLRFVTEGILTRRLLSEADLPGVAAVVLDEFHERHLEGDLALALLRRLQQKRPALRLLVMSATLDGERVAQYLDNCPVVRSEGRRFALQVEYAGYSPAPLEQQVAAAVAQVAGQARGILVFLPGAAEIRRAMRACAAISARADLRMLPLHGSLAAREQDEALAASDQAKLILSTNVAESSVTVAGVDTVIDSGLARFAGYSPWSGLARLEVGRISQASAQQRAGRAARLGPGAAIRLYSEEDFHRRAEHETPEILRAELTSLLLSLRAMNLAVDELEWMDRPPQAALERAEQLLDRLGACGEQARAMARFPLSPRLARLLVEAERRGVGDVGCRAAALLASDARVQHHDLLAALDEPADVHLRQQTDQLRRLLRHGRPRANAAAQPAHHFETDRSEIQHSRAVDEALLLAVLAGFPDRVARRRAGQQVLLAGGGSAEIEGAAPLYEFMVAVDAEERRDRTQSASIRTRELTPAKLAALIRLTARIEPEWLIELFAERIEERQTLEWNRAGQRVEAVSALVYDGLVIEESRGALPEAASAAALLAEKACEAGLERFVDRAALEALAARLEFAGFAAPDADAALRELCAGRRSFAELRAAAGGLLAQIEQRVAGGRLEELAPSRLRLPNGRPTKVHYERGQTPWIASRLQDFFGMKETPRLGHARTPVVVHLLAPNQRAVQTTTDLAGFWQRLYPEVRRELMRRYPKHAWPEKP